MPKIKITEIDNTGVVQSGIISNTVYIPGRVVASELSSIEPKLFTSISQLRNYNYTNYSASGTNVPLHFDDDALSYKLMEHLLSSGLYVLYEGVKEATAGTCPAIDWVRLEDKGLYDIRFLTMGEYDVIQSGMLECAKHRGDCVALLDHPKVLTDYYAPLEEEPSDWTTKWSENYKNRVCTKNTIYTAVSTGYESIPNFVPYVFYEKESTEYNVLIQAPSDWETAWGTYYYVSSETFAAVTAANAPSFEANKYYLPPASNNLVDKVRNYFESYKIDDSSFAAAFTPGFKSANADLGGSATSLVHIPASFGYLFAYAKSLQNNPEWYAVAGGQRGIIPELTEVEYNYTGAEIEQLQARAKTGEVPLDDDADNVGCAINPIAYVRPFGYIIWGNRTFKENGAAKKTTATSFLNVRNLVSAVKKSLYNAARRYTFEQNSDMLWVNFKSQIIPLLDQMKNGNGILGYKFVKLATPAKARLKARLILIPIEAVEDFEIEVELTDTISTTEE